jgi:hypothetical protein
MTNPNFDDDDEKPLDPVMEKLRRKMVRLLFVSSAAIVVALMAVLGALVYKANKASSRNAPIATEEALRMPMGRLMPSLPSGFKIATVQIDRNRLLIYGALATGEHQAFIFDVVSGEMISQVNLWAH